MTHSSSTTTTNLNLGLLETCIPLSSIVTVVVIVCYALPRQQTLGLAILIWWWMAVFLSLNAIPEGEGERYEARRKVIFHSPNTWSSGDESGILLLFGSNALILAILWLWIMMPPQSTIRTFVLQKIPLWGMIAVHTYRLDGLSLVNSFSQGKIPTFIGFQIIVLEIWLGGTALVSMLALHPRMDRLCTLLLKNPHLPRLRDVLWLWNSIGLYDLSSALLIVICNWAGFGGRWITDPPLSRLGFHPFPLLLLFQVPLAMFIHILCLTHLDELLLQHHQNRHDGHLLPHHVILIRAQDC